MKLTREIQELESENQSLRCVYTKEVRHYVINITQIFTLL